MSFYALCLSCMASVEYFFSVSLLKSKRIMLKYSYTNKFISNQTTPLKVLKLKLYSMN